MLLFEFMTSQMQNWLQALVSCLCLSFHNTPFATIEKAGPHLLAVSVSQHGPFFDTCPTTPRHYALRHWRLGFLT